MKYGLPYKGSKNKLAERIVRLLPKKKHLIDLFCGGCAVSHAALLMKKYEHIHINDVNWMCPTLFLDALTGKYNNETRWISREDFFRLKATDPYVAVIWSFGNNMRDYLYSKEIEPLKKAIHYALFFSDYSLGKELGHDLSFIDPIQDIQKRYLAVKHYFNRTEHFRLQSFEGGGRIPTGITLPNLATLVNGWGGTPTSDQQICNPSKLSIRRCSKKKSTRRDSELRTCQRNYTDCNTGNGNAAYPPIRGGQDLPITSSALDYAQVEIPEDSVIYCDIPYIGTDSYDKSRRNTFDYERFYQWAENQAQPVFISSYEMPADRFDCIKEFQHRSTLCATSNNLVTERMFVPKNQKERGNISRQLTLF